VYYNYKKDKYAPLVLFGGAFVCDKVKA